MAYTSVWAARWAEREKQAHERGAGLRRSASYVEAFQILLSGLAGGATIFTIFPSTVIICLIGFDFFSMSPPPPDLT